MIEKLHLLFFDDKHMSVWFLLQVRSTHGSYYLQFVLDMHCSVLVICVFYALIIVWEQNGNRSSMKA